MLCAYIRVTLCLHHTRHSCFGALWWGCSVVKLTFYLHQTPSLLWQVWTNSPVFTPPGYRPVGTTVQIIPRLHRIMDTRQVCEYLDSTISKVRKWQIITMLNRKLCTHRVSSTRAGRGGGRGGGSQTAPPLLPSPKEIDCIFTSQVGCCIVTNLFNQKCISILTSY